MHFAEHKNSETGKKSKTLLRSIICTIFEPLASIKKHTKGVNHGYFLDLSLAGLLLPKCIMLENT